MFQEFLTSCLKKAKYELIDNGKTYYGEVPSLKGVWATGKTLEQCRKNLSETIEGWTLLRIKKNLPIPNFKIPMRKVPLARIYAKA